MDIIKIQVRDKVFEIEERLIYQSNNYFSMMLKNKDKIKIDYKDGNIYVDRCSTYFHLILEMIKDPLTKIYDLFKNDLNKVNDNISSILYEDGFNMLIDDMKYYDVYPSDWHPLNKIELDEEKIIERVNKRFKDKGLEQLLELTKELDGCISGSFMLQCILDCKWDSDIDIYIRDRSLFDVKYNRKLCNDKEYFSDEKKSLLFDIERIKIRADDFYYSTNKLKSLEIVKNDYYIWSNEDLLDWNLNIYFPSRWIKSNKKVKNDYTNNLKCEVFTYIINNIKIDFIILQCSVKSYIEKFDFKFNSICYDGRQVYIPYKENVINKICMNGRGPDVYAPLELYKQNMLRIEKYFKRGFVILMPYNK